MLKHGEVSSRSTFRLNTSDQIPHMVFLERVELAEGIRVNGFRQTWVQIPPDRSLNLIDPLFPQVKEVIMNPVK